jgi:hypothetical protein
MVVPVPCGKLQSRHGLGAGARASSRSAAKALLPFAIALVACAPGARGATQEDALAARAIIVSSTLERIAPPADEVERIVSDAAAPSAAALIVSVRFTNVSDHVVDSVRITSPVPPDVQYVAGSASGPGAEVLFSVDNGVRFGRPDDLTLVAADGGVRSADAADYTHVRWVLRAPLDAGAVGVARFRAVPR